MHRSILLYDQYICFHWVYWPSKLRNGLYISCSSCPCMRLIGVAHACCGRDPQWQGKLVDEFIFRDRIDNRSHFRGLSACFKLFKGMMGMLTHWSHDCGDVWIVGKFRVSNPLHIHHQFIWSYRKLAWSIILYFRAWYLRLFVFISFSFEERNDENDLFQSELKAETQRILLFEVRRETRKL